MLNKNGNKYAEEAQEKNNYYLAVTLVLFGIFITGCLTGTLFGFILGQFVG